MKYCLFYAITALTLHCSAGNVGAQAQFPYSGLGAAPQNQPAFSPYLNLLRQGGSPTLNYFGLVRPQFDFQNSINNVQQQTALDTQAINNLQTGNLPTTGHPAMFQNLGGYFLSRGGGAGSANIGLGVRPGLANQSSPLNQNPLAGGQNLPPRR